MKYVIEIFLETTPQLRVSMLALMLLIVGVFETVGATAQGGPSSSTDLQSTPPSKEEKRASSAAAQPTPPPCPSVAPAQLQPSKPGTSHHKVILSWNASASSPNAGSSAVGYCVYRRKEKENRKEEKKNAAKLKPTCEECENVNLVPVIGTSCVDDVVNDGATYHYVVTAINAKGIPSFPSNEATAVIPREKQISSVPVSSPPPPSCRGASNTK